MNATAKAAPRVAVACAWYNRADHIRSSVDSLLDQDLESFEIVLVNDGSTDPRVKEILDSYDDRRLTVMHQENTGFTQAISRAIDESTAPYIAIMGAGDISYPQRLRLQLEAISSEEDYAICGCWYETVSHDQQFSRVCKPRTPQTGDLSFQFSQAELMYRRSVYEEVGGYRPFFVNGQGSDLWMRMMRKHRAVIVPQILHRQILFPGGVSRDRERILIRASLAGFRKKNEKVFRQTGIDFVDKYGHLAPLLIRQDCFSGREKIRAVIRQILLEQPPLDIAGQFGPITRLAFFIMRRMTTFFPFLRRKNRSGKA